MMRTKSPRSFIVMGGVGAIIVALCCFTPILASTLVLVGLGAWAGYLDLVLLPALAVFLGLFLYGLSVKRSGISACCLAPGSGEEESR